MLIGICGNKGAGKDTAASFLDGYTRMAFADKLKEAVANLFDISIPEVDEFKEAAELPEDDIAVMLGDYGGMLHTSLPWRGFLQRFGTEMGRNTFGEKFWVEQWATQYDILYMTNSDAAKKVVVTDVRFHNEASRIIWYGGHIIQITRPGCEPDGHASEDRLSKDLIDATVYNDGTLDDFRRKFLAVVEGLSVGVVSA